MFFVNICGKRTGKYMKKRILITGVLVALIMFVFILMGKKIVNSIWFKTQWDINFPFVESYYTVDGMWESYLFVLRK